MRRFAADVWWVAVYELGEAARTRLFQLVLLLYVGGMVGATWFFVKLLQSAEESAADTLGVPSTARPGAMMDTFLKNEELIAFVGKLAGEGTNVPELLREPLLGLYIGMIAMALLPAVLTFSASGSIATEVKSRSIRYLLCRTGRLQIGLGKLAGQLLIALAATLLGAAVCWALGMTLMVGNPPAALALSLLERSARASIWALPFAGIGLAASQWIPSPNGARVVAGSVVFAMPLAAFWLHLKSGTDLLGRLADLAGMFLATTAWADFWSTDLTVFGGAAVRSLVLAVVYYSVGHAVFARRNL